MQIDSPALGLWFVLDCLAHLHRGGAAKGLPERPRSRQDPRRGNAGSDEQAEKSKEKVLSSPNPPQALIQRVLAYQSRAKRGNLPDRWVSGSDVQYGPCRGGYFVGK